MKRNAFVLILVLLLLMAASVATAEVFTVENEQLKLALDSQTLDVQLTVKATGQTLSSVVDPQGTKLNKDWQGFFSSSLVIDVVEGTSVKSKQYALSSSEKQLHVTQVENGFDADIDFTAIGQRLRLQFRLDEDCLLVTVPADSIEEYGEAKLCGLYVLPAFGATLRDDKQGYMFVPEAAGALINLSDGKVGGSAPYSKRIYGANIGTSKSVRFELNRPAEEISMPVFGMTYTDDALGYIAVVETGGESAEIMAYPAGVITQMNWVSTHFIIREQYIAQTTRTIGLNNRESKPYLRDLSVRFCVLSGEEATYAGMARRYRKHLEDMNKIANADTTYRPRIDFLGAESASFLLWNSVEEMTSVRQMSDILSKYSQKGLTSPLVVYRGWQPGGEAWALGSGDVSLESDLGRADEITALAKTLKSDGGRLIMAFDPVQAQPDRMYNMRLDIVRTIGQTVAESVTGKDKYPILYYLTPARSAEIIRAAEKQWRDRADGIALLTLPHVLYSYYSQGGNRSRGDTLAAYCNAMSENNTYLALEAPLAEYFAYADAYLDLPLDTTNYAFLSAEVPFLPMVLSGHIPYYSEWLNFESNANRALLKLVEYGAYPSYLVTAEDVQKLINTQSSDVFTAQWHVIEPKLLKTDAELRALHKILEGARLIDHKILDNDVARAYYDNGCSVIVNYRRTEWSNDSVTVPAEGFVVLSAQGGVRQ